MKKLLSCYFSLMIALSGIGGCFNQNSCYAKNKQSSSTSTSSKSTKRSEKSKKAATEVSDVCTKIDLSKEEELSEKHRSGIKNVLSHPFKIIFRGLWWMIIGGFVQIIAPLYGIPALLGFICGTASSIMDLYDEGYYGK